MIMTRTPLRISLGGGGTDLPSYYREHGGFVLSAAINKYVYITVNRSFFPGYFLKYSENEHALTRDDIRHRYIRETLAVYDVAGPLEIHSMADVPAGTGLGSSGSFLVGLIHALRAHRRERATPEELAASAVDIEMNRLAAPVGKQDQYIAAYGGLLCQQYCPEEKVRVHPLRISSETIRELEDSLMLFFVGQTRSAAKLLDEQKDRSEQRDRAMLDGLHHTKQLGLEIMEVLLAGDVPRLGELMHEHWISKRARSSAISNDHIDELYELGRSRGGASGGKLVGAGGSGFLLFYAPDRKRLRRVMSEVGVTEMGFNFDFDGSVVMLRNEG